jgi:hypothetical protein
VPLTVGGKLSIVASADIGGLGSKTGSPVAYTWVLPSLAPQLLPWLLILGLLALKPNRCATAWWIWLPPLLATAFLSLPSVMLSGADFFMEVIVALVFGLSAIWLTAGYLRRSHRLLTWLCVLVALAGFSALAYVAKQGLKLTDIESLQVGPVFPVLLVAVAASSVALSLTGWICRRGFRGILCGFWLLLTMVPLWFLVALPFFLNEMAASNREIAWSVFFIPVLIVGTANYAVLLPFLILSGTNAFYRERLKSLLNIQPSVPPLLNAGPVNIGEPTKP